MSARHDKSPHAAYPVTPDGRYIVVRGRLWRVTNPALPDEVRITQVRMLMHARRDVATARQLGNADLMQDARRRVQAAKKALGERGPVWWTDGAPDYNRCMAINSPYRDWYQRIITSNQIVE